MVFMPVSSMCSLPSSCMFAFQTMLTTNFLRHDVYLP